MKLLQVPTVELEQRIKEELEANPALEEGREGEVEDAIVICLRACGDVWTARKHLARPWHVDNRVCFSDIDKRIGSKE